MRRSSPLKRSGGLTRSAPLKQAAGLERTAALPKPSGGLARTSGLRPASEKRMKAIAEGTERLIRPRKSKSESKRFVDEAHLAFIRTLPCIACGRTGCDVHHLLRTAERGMGRKSDDNHTLPMCHEQHMELHTDGNERRYLLAHAGIEDPVGLSEAIYAASGNPEAAISAIERAKKPTSVEA